MSERTDTSDDGRRLRRLNILFYAWVLGVAALGLLVGHLVAPTDLIGAGIGALLGTLGALLLAEVLFRQAALPMESEDSNAY